MSDNFSMRALKTNKAFSDLFDLCELLNCEPGEVVERVREQINRADDACEKLRLVYDQLESDAKLGSLVRRMPPASAMSRDDEKWWRAWKAGMSVCRHDTPEAALAGLEGAE